MSKLEKIKDISASYKVTTTTLRYYEKMGLIESLRSESSGYRLYDEAALVRLRQILILRKMNISIKDIQEIFIAKNSDAVLSVLDRKVDDIDNELALLHELKEIVLAFIQQLRKADFRNDTDVKMLFDKAMEIETSLTKENVSFECLFDTSDELDENLTSVAVENKPNNTPAKLENFEVIKIEPCRFVGKSVYARAIMDGNAEIIEGEYPTGKLFGNVWQQSGWIFRILDTMKEYATENVYNTALITWDKYDDKNQLQGYTVGRFMKADTPVPDQMDYIDIPETYVGKVFVEGEVELVKEWKTGNFFAIIGGAENDVKDGIRKHGVYTPASWKFIAEVYPESPNDNGNIPCWEFWCACE